MSDTEADNGQIEAQIKRAVAGDREAFAALLEAHYGLIYGVAYRWVGNKADAQDVAQDTCVKVARNITNYRLDGSFRGWLYRLTLNTARDWHKKAHRRNEKSLPEGFDTASDSPTPEKRAMLGDLLKAVEQLPDTLRKTVVLVFGEGLTHQDAAQALGCAETTISWRIHEARKELAGLWKDMGNDV